MANTFLFFLQRERLENLPLYWTQNFTGSAFSMLQFIHRISSITMFILFKGHNEHRKPYNVT